MRVVLLCNYRFHMFQKIMSVIATSNDTYFHPYSYQRKLSLIRISIPFFLKKVVIYVRPLWHLLWRFSVSFSDGRCSFGMCNACFVRLNSDNCPHCRQQFPWIRTPPPPAPPHHPRHPRHPQCTRQPRFQHHLIALVTRPISTAMSCPSGIFPPIPASSATSKGGGRWGASAVTVLVQINWIADGFFPLSKWAMVSRQYMVEVPVDHTEQLQRYGYSPENGTLVFQNLKEFSEFVLVMGEAVEDSFISDVMSVQEGNDQTKVIFSTTIKPTPYLPHGWFLMEHQHLPYIIHKKVSGTNKTVLKSIR